MNQFKGLPHIGRDLLLVERKRIDDVEDFAIKLLFILSIDET